MSDIKPDKVLDLKGLLCPMPVVKLAQAVKSAPIGGVIEATATDPGVLADIPAWAKTSGNELLEISRQEKVIYFLVKRIK